MDLLYDERSLQPKKEELKFLQLRCKRKQVIRKQMQEKSGVKNQRFSHACDDYGSFFGSSQPSIAPRLLQENSILSVLQNPNLGLARISKISAREHVTSGCSSSKLQTSDDHKPVTSNICSSREKAQMLRVMRDYSFLSSDNVDDHQIPASSNSPPSSAQVKPRIKESSSLPKEDTSSKRVSESKLSIACSQNQRGFGSAKSACGQPKKVLPLLARLVKTSMPRPSSFKNREDSMRLSPSAVSKQASAKKGEGQKADCGKQDIKLKVILLPKGSLPSSSKPRQNQCLKQPKAQKNEYEPRKKPKTTDIRHDYDDDDDDNDEDGKYSSKARSLIRKMFGYDPNKYHDDDDDRAMEVGFEDLQKEERRSAKIARKEDQEELRKIVDEERRDQLRKKDQAKKRKLSH